MAWGPAAQGCLPEDSREAFSEDIQIKDVNYLILIEADAPEMDCMFFIIRKGLL